MSTTVQGRAMLYLSIQLYLVVSLARYITRYTSHRLQSPDDLRSVASDWLQAFSHTRISDALVKKSNCGVLAVAGIHSSLLIYAVRRAPARITGCHSGNTAGSLRTSTSGAVASYK